MIQTEAQIELGVGFVMRGQVRRELDRADFECRPGCRIFYTESKSLLSSTFYITVSGRSDMVDAMVIAINNAAQGR